MAPRGTWLACADIGGSKISVSLAQTGAQRPTMIARRSQPTPKTGKPDQLAQQVLSMIGGACAQVGLALDQVRTLGVASCGPFLVRDSMVELAAPNICGGLGRDTGLPNQWTSVVLEAPLRAHFEHLQIQIDTIASLIAERRWGALQGQQHCAYLTWSTGIGMGLCVDGQVLRGKNGNAGHAGHMFVVDDDDSRCGCGNLGDVEGMIGGQAIERRYGVAAAALLAQAHAGDALARNRVDQLCRVMGRVLYNLVVTLDLQRISIGGSLFWNHREFLLPRLRGELQGKMPTLTNGCELVSAGLGSEVGDYGALALVT